MTVTDEREITRLQGILATDGRGCGNDSSDDYDCWENGPKRAQALGERGCEDGDVDPCWQGNEDPKAAAVPCSQVDDGPIIECTESVDDSAEPCNQADDDDSNTEDCLEQKMLAAPAVSAEACQGTIDGDDWCGEGGGPRAAADPCGSSAEGEAGCNEISASAAPCNEQTDDDQEEGPQHVRARAADPCHDADDAQIANCSDDAPAAQASGGDDDADYVCWAQKDSKGHAAATAAV